MGVNLDKAPGKDCLELFERPCDETKFDVVSVNKKAVPLEAFDKETVFKIRSSAMEDLNPDENFIRIATKEDNPNKEIEIRNIFREGVASKFKKHVIRNACKGKRLD